MDSQGLLVAWSAPFGRLCRQQPTEGMAAGMALGLLDQCPHEPGCFECDQECRDLRILCLATAVKKHLRRLFAHYGVRRRFELLAVVETIDVHNHREMQ